MHLGELPGDPRETVWAGNFDPSNGLIEWFRSVEEMVEWKYANFRSFARWPKS